MILQGSQTKQAEKSFIIGGHHYSAPPLPAGLYLIATPIGNLADITLRGLEVLAAADIIACEDTRTSRILLARYGICRKTIPYHEHNAREAGAALLRALQGGQAVALISDAGTPLVSDPGYPLVQQALAANIAIIPVPGASALLAALIGCGLPVHNFFFGGFLPPKQAARRKTLQAWQSLPCTMVFYESPRRVGACLADMAAIFGGSRPACLCRELTKKFETFDRGHLQNLAETYNSDTPPKGEIVLAIGGAETAAEALLPAEIDALLLHLAQTLPPARAAAEAARQIGGKKPLLYARLLELKNG
ncbi:MAG: 16S rRNA (cytidine(1402)-2'-O)-methyltransferase [Candidatus Tokpelaia sp.]|nr:MAG: 16S rRNA (cytidine(1402)-2'-O)-methyltransferase [Candidatus Tokpelaia sp.]KAA6207467.1 MAG: 16S rRNA (cytidine(1402)-2'-O)-methyltransferase [Candidatus Tokpelaia sp.]